MPRLRELRASLRDRAAKSSIGDEFGFVRELERVYRAALARGEKPGHRIY
jgi:hypothetical protein